MVPIENESFLQEEMGSAVTKTKEKRSRKQDRKPDKLRGGKIYIYISLYISYRIIDRKYYLEICRKYILFMQQVLQYTCQFSTS